MNVKTSTAPWSIRSQIESVVKEHTNWAEELCRLLKYYWVNDGEFQSSKEKVDWLAGGLCYISPTSNTSDIKFRIDEVYLRV